MGIPFGFGIAQVPALTSDIFGNDQYGFGFGIVQFGSIFSSIIAMPLMKSLGKTGTTVVFVVCGLLHIVESILWFFSKNNQPEIDTSRNEALV
jgi:Na+/melibiose symporter-like transporter